LGAEDSKGDRSEKDSCAIMLTNLPYKNNLFQTIGEVCMSGTDRRGT